MSDITIDGTSISGVTIDGTEVQEVTMDGSVVWVNSKFDSFEDNDLAEWTQWTDNGSATVVQSPVVKGTYSLELDNASTAGTHGIYRSTDGQQITPDELVFHFRQSGYHDNDTRVKYFQGKPGSGNESEVIHGHLRPEGDVVEVNNTSVLSLAALDKWYKIRCYNIDWANYTFDVEATNLTDNTSNTVTGIGFNTNVGYVDYVSCQNDGNDPYQSYYDLVQYYG